jgi:hypothetical protein
MQKITLPIICGLIGSCEEVMKMKVRGPFGSQEEILGKEVIS